MEIGFTPRFIFHHAPEPTRPVISLKQWGGFLTPHMCFFDFKQSRETFNCDLMQSGVEGDVHIPFYCRRNVRFCCIFGWAIHQLFLCRHRRVWADICKSTRNFMVLITVCADETSVWIQFFCVTTLRLWVMRWRLLEAA